jgi:hypothetical protein
MKCKSSHKKLIFFLEGELPENEMKTIQEHLDDCPDCKAFANELQKTLGIIDVEKNPEVNPFFYTRLKAKLENRDISEKPFWKPFLVKVLQPAFFVVLLLIGIYGGFKIGQPLEKSTSQMYSVQEVVPYLNEMSAEPIEAFLME